METRTLLKGQTAWLRRATLDDVEYQRNRGGISQAAYEAYMHVWATAVYRWSSLTMGWKRHPTDADTLDVIDALKREGLECCQVSYDDDTPEPEDSRCYCGLAPEHEPEDHEAWDPLMFGPEDGSLSTELLAALTLSIIPTTIVLVFVARLVGMVAGVS